MTKGRLAMGVGTILATGALVLWLTDTAARAATGPQPAGPTSEQLRCAGFDVEITGDPARGGADLTIARAGQALVRLHGTYLTVGGDAGDPRWLEPGTDVTGDGRPNLVVWGWSGRPGGGTTTWVFDLADEASLLARFDDAGADVAGLTDLDGDDVPEVVTRDWSLAGWRGLGRDAAPRVVLRWREGDYRLATDLARPSHAPALPDLSAAPEWAAGDPPRALVVAVLERLYAGAPDAAWDLLDAAWPAHTAGRDRFGCALLGRLSESPYWIDLDVSRRVAVSSRTAR